MKDSPKYQKKEWYPPKTSEEIKRNLCIWLFERYDYDQHKSLLQGDVYRSVEEFFQTKLPNDEWNCFFQSGIYALKKSQKFSVLNEFLISIDKSFILRNNKYCLTKKKRIPNHPQSQSHSLLRNQNLWSNQGHEYEDESETEEVSVEIAFEDENIDSRITYALNKMRNMRNEKTMEDRAVEERRKTYL